jgi:hypothetical protein
MNDSQHVITIEPSPDNTGAGGVMFRAPADNQAARQLWVFLVENLRPGFVVELSSYDGAAELTRLSGAKLSPELYAAVMGGKGGRQ